MTNQLDIKELLTSFLENNLNKNTVDIYNEISLQLELGIYLRNTLPPNYKVEFERNVRNLPVLDEAKSDPHLVKHEIDIVVINKEDSHELYAIELKYPRNEFYKKRMYHFVTDIRFMEEVKDMGATNAYALTIVDKDKEKYYKGNDNGEKIYSNFRCNTAIEQYYGNENMKGFVPFTIQGKYYIEWKELNNYMYYIIDIGKDQ